MDKFCLYSLVGMGVGLICLVLGVCLVYFGPKGNTTLHAKLGPLEIKTSTCIPGITVAILGVIVIFITRLVVN